MQHKNTAEFQEILRLILLIYKKGIKTKWMRHPKICANISKIILENDLDPKEIYSFCNMNGAKISLNMFYNLPRGHFINQKIKWEELIMEMYNLNIEPCETFYTVSRLPDSSSIQSIQNNIGGEYCNQLRGELQNELNKESKRELKVKFSIGTEIHRKIQMKIMNGVI